MAFASGIRYIKIAKRDKYKKVDPKGISYGVRLYSGSLYAFSEWIDDLNKPLDGYISMWFQDNNIPGVPSLPIEDYNVVGDDTSSPSPNPPNDSENQYTPER